MNRRYIDFVPVDRKNRKVVGAKEGVFLNEPQARENDFEARAGALEVRKGAPRRMAAKKASSRADDELSLEEIFEERAQPAGVSTGGAAKFGIFEDYHPKFVRTEVAKRPLGKDGKPKKVAKTSAAGVAKTSAAGVAKSAKMSKPVAKLAANPATKPVAQKSAMISKSSSYIAGPMITKYLRTDRAEKRPLSEVSTKKAVSMHDATLKAGLEAKEEKKVKKSPERIISKPDKDSKAGMIIAVVLTIILGAAAGTVAFLLLPK